MSLKDFLFGKPQPAKEAPGQLSRPLSLAPAPDYRPVPARSADLVDAKVSELWRMFQNKHRPANWEHFVRDLEAGNAERAKRLAEIKTRLVDYPPNKRFVP